VLVVWGSNTTIKTIGSWTQVLPLLWEKICIWHHFPMQSPVMPPGQCSSTWAMPQSFCTGYFWGSFALSPGWPAVWPSFLWFPIKLGWQRSFSLCLPSS
jgi:hypothetical protein